MATVDRSSKSEAEQFPGFSDGEQTKWFAQRTGSTVTFVLPHLRSGMDLLDIGCGAGSITLDLARIVHPGRVVGIEVNDDQLAKAEANLSEAGLDNVTFVQMDASTLDLDESSFDAVVAFSTLQYLPDVRGTLRSVKSLLRPGGFFATRDREVSGDLVGGRYRDDIVAMWELTTRVWEGKLDIRLGHQLKGLLEETGFETAEASASYESWGSRERLAEYTRLHEAAMGPGGWNRKLHIESGLVDEADMEDQDRKYRRWANDPAAWFAMCRVEAIGWKPT